MTPPSKTIEEALNDEDLTPDEKKDKPEGILKILLADSADKKLEDYTDHPLNYDHSDSTGRILRGVEGMIGNLDKALVDIIAGCVQKLSGLFKKKGE